MNIRKSGQKLRQDQQSNENLTVEEVLKTPGFEELNEKEAEAYIENMEQLCWLFYEIYQNHSRDERQAILSLRQRK